MARPLIVDTLKKLFPNDFEELVPVRKHWWQKVDFDNLKKKEGLIAFFMIATVLLMGVYYYNKFIELARFTEMEQHQIDVQLQRRKDLSLNLTTMVIDYAEHERTMFQYMADKRADSLQKNDMLLEALNKSGLMNMAKTGTGNVEEAVAKLMAIAEAYPDLKLSSNFQKLMDSLVTSEDRIAGSRMEYNKAASLFHAYVRKIPACIYAFIFGYKEEMFHYAELDKDLKTPDQTEIEILTGGENNGPGYSQSTTGK